MTTNTESLPTKREMIPYYLMELHHLGGSATVQDVIEKLGERFELSEEQLQITTEKNDRQPAFFTRVQFARLELFWAGYLESLSRSIWSLSKRGKEVIPDLMGWDRESNKSKLDKFTAEIYKAVREREKARIESKKKEEAIDGEDNIEEGLEEQEVELTEGQLNKIQNMDPFAFERLCGRLFQAVNFVGVKVTKGSGDGGIDGYGFLSFGLVKFKVVFQAKRLQKGTKVGPDIVERLSGSKDRVKAEKAFIITTSDFTGAATKAASELDIECINGERLIKLLQEHELGYSVEKVDKKYKFDPDFFDNI